MNLSQQLNVICNSDHRVEWQTKILQPSTDIWNIQMLVFWYIANWHRFRSWDTHAELYCLRDCSWTCLLACFQDEGKLKASLAWWFISILSPSFVLSFGNIISKTSRWNSRLLRPTIQNPLLHVVFPVLSPRPSLFLSLKPPVTPAPTIMS